MGVPVDRESDIIIRISVLELREAAQSVSFPAADLYRITNLIVKDC